ncbi:MAG: orotidine-5'-phosphate decarboxylase [Acidobacteriota bacterium]
MNSPRSKLIVALDVADRQSALHAVRQLSGHVGYFKIGLELFTREGPRLVEEIRDRGEKIFLDLKLHDIPNTVAGAMRSACKLGIDMITVHASGGSAMLEAASKEAESAVSPPVVLAVTALTSLSEADMRRFGVQGTMEDWVRRLAETAREAGIHGLVRRRLRMPLAKRSDGRSKHKPDPIVKTGLPVVKRRPLRILPDTRNKF